MVLESLSNAYNAEMHPSRLILHGMLYAVVGMLLGLWTFPQYASIVMVFFISLASMPLLYAIIKYEEDKDYHAKKERFLIKEHSRAILAYLALFLGITIALTLMYFILPQAQLEQGFNAQINTYGSINPHHDIAGQITGQVTGQASGSVSYFNKIFLNNMRVLVLATLFSFAYGAGAIFILAWNASVLALAIGYFIQTKVAQFALQEGVASLTNWASVTVYAFTLRYGIHGFLEIAAYMTAALAGGIISVAAIRHHFSTKAFEHIVIDSADLLLIAIALLIAGAGWEAFITPAFNF